MSDTQKQDDQPAKRTRDAIALPEATGADVAAEERRRGATVLREVVPYLWPPGDTGTKVRVVLHPEVSATIEINIARSPDEAERQARGENVLSRRGEIEDDAAAEAPEFFDETTGAAADAE